MCPEAVSLLEGSCLKAGPLSLKPDVLHTLDSLYAFYHRRWWCYSHMYRVFKLRQALLNGVALLVVAAGMIAGPICENSIVVTCLARTAWGGCLARTCLGNRAQRTERFQEISHQGGQVPICLHHVRQDLDRAPNLRTRHSIR